MSCTGPHTFKSISLRGTIVIALYTIVFNFTVMNAQNDTLYFDSQWRPTAKDSAAYFRPPFEKRKGLFVKKDYYISGQLQMEGLSKSGEKDDFEGKVTWYTADGRIYQQGMFKNNRLEGEYITFMADKKLVALYKNGKIDTGKINVRLGAFYRLTEHTKDSVHTTIYETDIESIRYETFGTKDNPKALSKFYGPQGKLIGELFVGADGSSTGVEVLYYADPMRVKEINYHPFGQQLIATTYYTNGQVREQSLQGAEWSTTYFDTHGNRTGKITYRLDGKILYPIEGTQQVFVYDQSGVHGDVRLASRSYDSGVLVHQTYYHDNGQVASETFHEKGIKQLQVSYDEKGRKIAQMEYRDHQPYNGTEMEVGRTSTYDNGKRISETIYHPNTKIAQVLKTDTLEVYYDKGGKVLGELQVDSATGYVIPKEGQRFVMDYSSGDVSVIEKYTDGNLAARTAFRKRMVGKDEHQNFKTVETYGSSTSGKTREARFYSNGKLQSDIEFKDYEKMYGQYYDKSGVPIGEYDFLKKEGTLYVFFDDSDEIRRMEERKAGVLLRTKQYVHGTITQYAQITPVLIADIDIDCCARFYSRKGKLLGEVTYENRIPWKGTWYSAADGTLYALKNGQRNGSYKKLNTDENVIEEGQFLEGNQEGLFKYYDNSGNLLRSQEFKAGLLNGTAVYYDTDGTVKSKMVYKDDQPTDGMLFTSQNNFKTTQQETYKNGAIVERISDDGSGKRITRFSSEALSETTLYRTDSQTKRLTYSNENGKLSGNVVRYDNEGGEQHTALFKKGKLVSGTVYLKPGYNDKKLLFIAVTRNGDTLRVALTDVENKVIFKAEELVSSGPAVGFLYKLELDLGYIRAERLY